MQTNNRQSGEVLFLNHQQSTALYDLQVELLESIAIVQTGTREDAVAAIFKIKEMYDVLMGPIFGAAFDDN